MIITSAEFAVNPVKMEMTPTGKAGRSLCFFTGISADFH